MSTGRERRKHPHFQVSEETALLTAPKLEVSDDLIDVSLGGLAFRYEDSKPFHTGTSIRIDIVVEDLSIMDIPAKIISDVEISHHPNFSRRCGVQFGKLSKEQKEKLSFLIAKVSAMP